MRSEFGLLGCILTIDSTENCLAECSVRFIYIRHRAALVWIFGDGRAVGSDGLTVVCNRLCFQGDNREFDKTLCWGSDFGLLGCILNIDSPENRLVECSVRFIYIQHRAALGWLFATGEMWVLTVWELFAIACTSKEVIANLIRLFVGATAEDSEFNQNITYASPNVAHITYLVNNSVRSRNHAISVTLNLGAVRIIWPACKPVHILYIKRLHSRVRSQSALICLCCWGLSRTLLCRMIFWSNKWR